MLATLTTPDLERLARRALSALLVYDAEHGGDLVHTLREYFRCDGNATRAADHLFLHRNGLLYRLNRAEELLGIHMDNPELRLALELSIYLIGKEKTGDANKRP